MSLPHAPGRQSVATPRFYVTPSQRVSPGIILLAVIVAFGCVPPVLYALSHSRHASPSNCGVSSLQPCKPSFDATSRDDQDDDDPSRVDTIYLADAADAPVPTRPGSHPSTVHPFIVVHLPRSGDQVGQIPDSPAGHLLYDWLAAFNSKDPSASGKALISDEVGVAEAEIKLRKLTGGFTLLSAKEVQPGVLVFRLHDQTPAATEVLGALQVRPNSDPASIASFSLGAVPQPQVNVPLHSMSSAHP